MLKSMLACCKIYISESRNKTALDAIERAARRFPEAVLVNKFEDETYNRVGYTLVSKLPAEPVVDKCGLRGAVFEMVRAAFDNIDFQSHCGSHPRLGVVDHICFHPLAYAEVDDVTGVAKLLAADVGSSFQVPTFLYGRAHKEGTTLDSIRRQLGYFKSNSGEDQWVGTSLPESLPLKPDEGPALVSPSKGVVVIGATPWVDNYNVPVFTADLPAARKLAKRVSARGGGLPKVQAMALTHGDNTIEVACNLLEPNTTSGDQVQLEVERLASEEGMAVGKGYFTDFSQDQIIARYNYNDIQ